jgi:hypothetical protein
LTTDRLDRIEIEAKTLQRAADESAHKRRNAVQESPAPQQLSEIFRVVFVELFSRVY